MDSLQPIDPREPLQQQPRWQAQQQPWSPPQPQWQAQPQPQWQTPPPPQWQAQPQLQYPGQMIAVVPQKSWIATVLLCHFLGILGVHRFYAGRVVSGIFQLLTFGGLGIWVLVDYIMIITGSFTDSHGFPLFHPPVRGGDKNWVAAALLCIFVGTLGIHRFYTGHIVSGIFQLLTFGGCGIWTLIDLILIYTDSFRDGNGLPLTRMEVQVYSGVPH